MAQKSYLREFILGKLSKKRGRSYARKIIFVVLLTIVKILKHPKYVAITIKKQVIEYPVDCIAQGSKIMVLKTDNIKKCLGHNKQ